jgi:predicted transcriptional regulator
MDKTDSQTSPNLVGLTADVVAAYVTHNSVQKGDIAALIASVHASLTSLGQPQPAAEAERPTPAVPIKKSIGQDYLISLEDGRRYKSLKRHLSGRGLTPEQYREKWGLPLDYPMVAPSYAKQRSELAKSMGLGRQRRKEAGVEASPDAAAAGEGRRRKGE